MHYIRYSDVQKCSYMLCIKPCLVCVLVINGHQVTYLSVDISYSLKSSNCKSYFQKPIEILNLSAS